MTLDFATTELLKQLAESDSKPLHMGSVDEARTFSASMADQQGPAPAMFGVEEHNLSTPEGTIHLRVLIPLKQPAGVIVYYHGGGWVIGSIDETDTVARKLAERTSCSVVLVEYRLAPEHRFPAAVNDSYAALSWASEHLPEISRPNAPLFVAGDSAGGNLAAVMALRARDQGGPPIAAQILIYPVTDADFERPSYTDPANQLLLTREAMAWFWNHYAPEPEHRQNTEASPLRASDLRGLPPAVVLTAEHDVLRDEGEAYAEQLRKAGVPVNFVRYEGQTHGFFTLLMLPGSEAGFQQVVKAVRTIIHEQFNKAEEGVM
ncbi:MAG: esterase [Dehalococcoidia bacterium]|nr:esterase [Dehalococcoidia bacterium]|tara:strand:- start:8339 stop:9295 length:957 start_codon:yes stop_codon:yes gene_type:complete